MIVTSKKIRKQFYNHYLDCMDEIDLTYSLPESFHSVEEFKAEIRKSGTWDPELFYCIKLDNEVYAVTMECLGNQLVLSLTECFYRVGRQDMNGFRGDTGYFEFEDLYESSCFISNPRVNQYWNDEVEKDIRQLFNVEITKGDLIDPKKLPEHQCVILLATILFNTKIPVFQLDVMNEYFADSPSRWKLWKQGICAYNPYNNDKQKCSKSKLEAERRLLY